jgi:hypothetical protein
MKKKIYPNPAEMKAAITFFFKKTDDEFFSTFSNTGWNNYYNKKIRKNVSKFINFYFHLYTYFFKKP